MLDTNPLLNHLRSKPPRTRTTIAIVAAFVPTIAVAYAQFYMRNRDTVSAPTAVAQSSQDDGVSVFAAVGKIFDEGKKTVDASVKSLSNVDLSVLDSAVITATGSSPAKLRTAAPSAATTTEGGDPRGVKDVTN